MDETHCSLAWQGRQPKTERSSYNGTRERGTCIDSENPGSHRRVPESRTPYRRVSCLHISTRLAFQPSLRVEEPMPSTHFRVHPRFSLFQSDACISPVSLPRLFTATDLSFPRPLKHFPTGGAPVPRPVQKSPPGFWPDQSSHQRGSSYYEHCSCGPL